MAASIRQAGILGLAVLLIFYLTITDRVPDIYAGSMLNTSGCEASGHYVRHFAPMDPRRPNRCTTNSGSWRNEGSLVVRGRHR